MTKQRPLLAFFGHHKCATKYVLAILKQVCADCGLKLITISSVKDAGTDLRPILAESAADVLAHMNSQWLHASQLENMRGFHVVRDPRDVLVSAYFSHLYSHETQRWSDLSAHRRRLQELDKARGLMLEMDFIAPVFRAMYEWRYDDAKILEIRFERMIANPYQAFLQVFAHLELLDEEPRRFQRALFWIQSMINHGYRFGTGPLPLRWPTQMIPAERLLRCVHANRFSKRTGGRAVGEEDVQHHFRKGVPGDWRNHFTAEHTREFNRRYGALLELTGYDRSKDAEAA